MTTPRRDDHGEPEVIGGEPTHHGKVVDHTPEGPPTEAAERTVIAAFLVAIAAALGLAAVYWEGGQPQLEGALLAVALGGIGVGMVVWAKRFLPGDEVAEARPPLASTDEEIAAFTADFERGEHALQRRSLLLKLFGGAVAALGVAALFPIRSLGPRPGAGLLNTGYRRGTRLVTAEGEPLRPDDLAEGSVVTVWPEGRRGEADSPTLLINVGSSAVVQHRPGREDWLVGPVIAYSKLCTHTGCPVGLYQQDEQLLLCPCHQSTFDVLDGARPVFGPANRPLPQLPLDVDGEGYLVSTGEFSDAVGASFWDRPRSVRARQDDE